MLFFTLSPSRRSPRASVIPQALMKLLLNIRKTRSWEEVDYLNKTKWIRIQFFSENLFYIKFSLALSWLWLTLGDSWVALASSEWFGWLWLALSGSGVIHRLVIPFKIGALKNFAIFTGKQLCWPLQAFFYRTSTVAASEFLRQKIFFQLNLVIIADSCTGFCSKLLWKHELNLRSSHCNSSVKKGFLRNFVNFTGKYLGWSDSSADVFLWNLQYS